MPQISQDRLVRKEVALGVVREIPPPLGHMGLSLVPFQDVESDDVIFDYTKGVVTGLAPARAEDAESEMAAKDDFVGTGRASIIDWAIKDHYDPSDVSRYREALLIGQQLAGATSLPLTITRMIDGYNDKLARDSSLRRRKLDNRIESLIMGAIDTSVITYNDGKIKFTVDYGRPAGQLDEAPANGTWISANAATMNPIADILAMQETMWNTYQVRMTRAIASRKAVRSLLYANSFKALSPFGTSTDPNYTIPGWGIETAMSIVEQQTGVKFIGPGSDTNQSVTGVLAGFPRGTYDAVYRTRPIGSQTITNNRFSRENSVIFLPSEEDMAAMDDNLIGFGKTLTSPHPEGNWGSGYYEWERSTVDPWGHDAGTGIKAFPVLPHLDLTFNMLVF